MKELICEMCGEHLPWSTRHEQVTFLQVVTASVCNPCRREVDAELNTHPLQDRLAKTHAAIRTAELRIKHAGDELAKEMQTQIEENLIENKNTVNKLAELVRKKMMTREAITKAQLKPIKD